MNAKSIIKKTSSSNEQSSKLVLSFLENQSLYYIYLLVWFVLKRRPRSMISFRFCKLRQQILRSNLPLSESDRGRLSLRFVGWPQGNFGNTGNGALGGTSWGLLWNLLGLLWNLVGLLWNLLGLLWNLLWSFVEPLGVFVEPPGAFCATSWGLLRPTPKGEK